MASTVAPQVRRVYRWGPMWGLLSLAGTRTWVSEKRSVIAENAEGVLESVKRSTYRSPDVHVDDVWDEEVVYPDTLSEYNGLLSVCGTAEEVRGWCLKYELPVPADIPASVNVAQAMSLPHHHPKPQQYQQHQQHQQYQQNPRTNSQPYQKTHHPRQQQRPYPRFGR
jgi:hypothetical protein